MLKEWFKKFLPWAEEEVPPCKCEVIELLPRPKIPERRGSPLTAQKAVAAERRKAEEKK